MVLSVSTDRVWLRMTEAMGHPEWATDPRYVSNPERTRRPDEVDAMVGDWFAAHTAEEAQRLLDAAGVPVSPIYSIADIFEDAQYRARGDIITPEDPEVGPVPMPGVLPRFSRTPGGVRFVGPGLGEHNAQIYGGLLGLSEAEQEALREDGII
jgi:crotonobetainyl-CoA:carnitine CoA-transferase CaiB-like acyl-CoA transferase